MGHCYSRILDQGVPRTDYYLYRIWCFVSMCTDRLAVHFDVTLDYLILGKVETKTELALSKKINDQKQAMKSLREQLLAFAMEIEVE